MALTNGQLVVVAGKRGVVMEVADKVKVLFEDGNYGFFEVGAVTPEVLDTRMKMGDYALMHATATGDDPLAQPLRTTGRGIGENQTVLGKTVSKDVFSKP